MPLDLGLAVPLFLLRAAVIGVGGTAMTSVADCLAERTGPAEALIGGVPLGVSTSLSGTVTSISAAHEGHAALAVANGLGGIAVQTVFLAVGDLLYRRANLEHAAASITSLVQLGLLHRERRGMGAIGWESVTLIGIYLCGLLVQVWGVAGAP